MELKNEAKEIVDNAPLTNDGFLTAWNQLSSQCDNRRMQINALLKTILNLPMSLEYSEKFIINLRL